MAMIVSHLQKISFIILIGIGMAHLIIVRGLPGSGKSTFAKQVLKNYVHVEADQYFEDAEGNYNFNPTRLREAHESCWVRVCDALDAGWDVAVSNTFTQHWEMLSYIKYCNQNGHTYTVVKCEGNYGSIHNVPSDAIERMRKRWQNL